MREERQLDDDASASRMFVCTCGRLRRTARLATRHYDRALKPVGLKLTQYSILANVARREGLTVTQLARLLGLERTTLTRNLRPLQTTGWLAIDVGADHRSRQIRLTDLGREKLAEARPLWRAAEQEFRRAVGSDTAEELVRLLDKAFREAPTSSGRVRA